MREVFGEWYTYGDDERGDFVTKARIALDANVLLDLYRISKESREKILAQLERDEIRPRLFLPYRAGLEYHRQRLSVADDHAKQYASATSIITRVKKNGANSPLLRELRTAVEGVKDTGVQKRLLDAVDAAFKTAATEVEEALRTERESNILHTKQIQATDPIRDRSEKLFTDPGQVGRRRTSTDLRAWEDQARARLAAAIPPGTGADEAKQDGGIGDPLIWMEMMDLAKTDEQDVLFVSNDMKADWRHIVDDEDFGTLPDLRREFADETGQRYHHVSTDTFLQDLNKYLNADVGDEVIDEVKHTRVTLSPTIELPTLRVADLYPDLTARNEEMYRNAVRGVNMPTAQELNAITGFRSSGIWETLRNQLAHNQLSELSEFTRSPEFQRLIWTAQPSDRAKPTDDGLPDDDDGLPEDDTEPGSIGD